MKLENQIVVMAVLLIAHILLTIINLLIHTIR